MAYNPYPYQYQQPYQPYQQQPPQQIQNSGFISARSIEEAYNWPVAPGNSVTFKIENTPYVCTKTKGFSPLDQPVFERYRLVKEEDAPKEEAAPVQAVNYDEQINQLWDEIKSIKNRMGGRKRHDKPADDSTGETVHE